MYNAKSGGKKPPLFQQPDGKEQEPSCQQHERHNAVQGVSVCQWQTSCEPTEPAGETRGAPAPRCCQALCNAAT